MNCKKCGAPLTTEDQFCKNCGASVNAQPIQNNGGLNNNSIYNMPNQNINNGVNPTPVNNGYSTMPTQNQNMAYSTQQSNNGSKNNMIIIIIVVITAIVLLAIFIVPKFLNNSNENGNSKNKINNNEENTVTPAKTSSYKVNYDGFTLNVPDNMMYETANNELMIGDEDGTWVVELTITDGNFNKLKSNKGQLQSYFNQNGFKSTPAEVKTLGGTEFITLEMVHSGVNFVGAYAKLNSMKIVWLIAYNQDNTTDYDILTKIAPILSSATYNDSSNSIASPNKFNFNIDEISGFAQ